MEVMELKANGITVILDYVIAMAEEALIYGFFSRSEFSVRGFAANVSRSPVYVYSGKEIMLKKFVPIDTENFFTKLVNGRENVHHGICISKEIGDKYIFTEASNEIEDIYQFLMKKFNLPLKREWIPYILENAPTQLCKCETTYYGEQQDICSKRLYNCLMTEEELSEIISKGLESRKICISQKEQKDLVFENMDDYFNKYGHTLVSNLDNVLNPLVPLVDRLEEVAFLNRRLYPQQAAIANGLIENMNHNSYGIENMDMGTGKTLVSLAVIEGFFNRRYLKAHPKKTIKEMYSEPSSVKYRNVIMCPSHMVQKWKASIEEDIPYAKVIIIRDLGVLINLKNHGRLREGKEFYILSKDIGKLSYMYKPTPTQKKCREVKQYRCSECNMPRPSDLHSRCTCGSNHWVLVSQKYKKEGLICPECGELLFPADVSNLHLNPERADQHLPLQPIDFAKRTEANKCCRHCGASLWQPSCAPLFSEFFVQPKLHKSEKWIRISHFTNKTRKHRTTAWVYKKEMEEYVLSKEIREEDIEYPKNYGPRKFAPARFINKQLRGFFDFAIFDEVHECEFS